jgi:hypothetical protein
LYTLDELKENRETWKGLDLISVKCSWCDTSFEIKNGTLYNIIRREADGVYCSRKCAGSGRAYNTQDKYQSDGGKTCKRCGEFKSLDNFSKLPNPPYLRSECRRCHNYKPARSFSLYKERAAREQVPFLITLDDFASFWNKKCFYCSSDIKKIRIEMLNPDMGYEAKNVVSCCADCQKLKGDLKHLEFVNMCHKISDNLRR